jgi:hypothetical protein
MRHVTTTTIRAPSGQENPSEEGESVTAVIQCLFFTTCYRLSEGPAEMKVKEIYQSHRFSNR